MSQPQREGPLCQVTMGEFPGYYKCDRPAKYVTDGTKPPGKIYLCGIHKRGRKCTPIPPTPDETNPD
jgi:hypothetical protein